MVCLDTSIIIDFLKGRENAVSTIASYSSNPEGLSTTSITVYELLKYKNLKEKEKMLMFVSRLKIHNFDMVSAGIASDNYLSLKEKGSLIKEFDILIAGIAKANNEIVLTSDRDFETIGSDHIRIVSK